MKEEHQILIDALPYIDNYLNDDNEKEIEKLIDNEMKNINIKDIDEEINKKFNSDITEINNKDKIDKINFLNFNFDIPKDKKNDEEWNNVFKHLNSQIENFQNESLNLELMNTIGVKYWEYFIKNLKNVLNLMEEEKNTLNSDILYLNKKRKFNQMNYKEELDKLQNEINTKKNIIKESLKQKEEKTKVKKKLKKNQKNKKIKKH
jgi:hypothetical protein